MYFHYIKALHIIFVITWFSGLFYMVRLFVYFAEAATAELATKSILQKQYQLMQRRLWFGITWPSALLTAVFGTLLALEYPVIPSWLWVKIGFVVLLFIYQFVCHHYFKAQQRGESGASSTFFRIWNEVATILLVGIVFLVVLKNFLSLLWGLIGLVVFSGILVLAIRIYKSYRSDN